MKKQFKLGIIGCGFMAHCILKAIILSDFLHEKKIIVSDVSDEKLESVNYLGVKTTTDNKYVAENSEFLLFAVKPQDFPSAVHSLNGYCPEKIISVMAGIKKNAIKNYLGLGVIKVARCMPNLPCSIGSGAIGIDMTDFNKSPDDTDFISNIFNNMGTIVSLEENKMDAVTGIGGSGPAYVFLFIDSLIEAGVKQGLSRDEAKILAVQTVAGSAELVADSGESIENLLLKVCSKGGTTIEALKVLQEQNFEGIISDAVEACVKKSKLLSEK